MATAQVSSYFGYSPDTPLHLGGGLIPEDLARSFEPCVKATETLVDGPGTLKSTFTMFVATNEHAVQEAMGIDVKVHAASPFAKGDATFHEETSSDFDENTAAIVIRGEAEYSRHTLTDIALSENALIALKKSEDAFTEQCGTHVVTEARMGVMTSIVVTLHHLSQENKRKITASADVSGGIGVVTASVQAAVTSSFGEKDVSNESVVQVIASGGLGLPGLSDVVTASATPPDLTRMLSALKIFFATLTKENAAPIGYFIAPLPSPAPPSPSDPVYPERMRAITAISDRYIQTTRLLTSARSIISGTDARSSLLTEKTTADLAQLANSLYQDVQALEIEYHNCARASNNLNFCKLPEARAVPSILADGPLIQLTTLIRTRDELLSPAVSKVVFTDPSGGDLPTRLHRRGLSYEAPDVYSQVKGAIVGDLSLKTKEDGIIRFTAYPNLTPMTKRSAGGSAEIVANTLLVGLELDFSRQLKLGESEIKRTNGRLAVVRKPSAPQITVTAPDPDVWLPVLEVAIGYVCLSTTTDATHGLLLTIRRLADPVNNENNDFDFGTVQKLTKPDGNIEVTYKTQDEIIAGVDGWTFSIPKGDCN